MARHRIKSDATADLRQALASDPSLSAWVGANAGSGKTTVLARRVRRLLLAGVPPGRILCLTFTRSAAAEMERRVFDDLAEWVRLDRPALIEALAKTLDRQPDETQLSRARTLFARALDTPGGLNIQTIHAFCTALLQRFPLEANVPGAFSGMDDAEQAALAEEVRRQTLAEAHGDRASAIGAALREVLATAGEDGTKSLLAEVIGRRPVLARLFAAHGDAARVGAATRASHGFGPNATVAGLAEEALEASLLDDGAWGELLAACAADKSARARAIEAAAAAARDPAVAAGERLAALEGMHLTKDGRPRASLLTKGLDAAAPGMKERLEAEAARLIGERGRRLTLGAIERTAPVLTLAEAMIARYERAKRRRGVLDYDDLIERAADLLTSRDARDWVLYKLDRGIDHVLVDEAQDTSAAQWRIVSAITDAFFDGEGARTDRDAGLPARTVFAVGDEKQSIFSFQGAEPRLFARTRDAFKRRAEAVGRRLEPVPMRHSFRSTRDVLAAVDRVFTHEERGRGLTSDDYEGHTTARRDDRGEVEIWSLEEGTKEEVPTDWTEPMAAATPHETVRLARRIAARLDGWFRHDERLTATGSKVGPGDILILVRNRSRIVDALTRELKAIGIPVAGADRLAVGDHIATQDLVAAGQAMVVPDDDLSLAALLKSPLFGLSEETLYELARHGVAMDRDNIAKRHTSLWDSLHALADTHEALAGARERLARWQAWADELPPYEFFARILGDDRGRHRFAARLGPEVHELLDAFLDRALAHEADGTPGLAPFLRAMVATDQQIKRELDRTPGAVRIMTVHAAKGLEAPVVFLIDSCGEASRSNDQPRLFTDAQEGDGVLWRPSSGADHGCPPTDEALETKKRRDAEEHRRLLYVAMTRAEDRLVVCGHCTAKRAEIDQKTGRRSLPQPSWHQMVTDALPLGECDPVRSGASGEEPAIRVWREPGAPAANPRDHDRAAVSLSPPPAPLPAWARQRMPHVEDLPRPLSPSSVRATVDEALVRPSLNRSLLAETPSAAPPDAAARARARGTAIHALFQHVPDLPFETRWQTARAYLDRALAHETEAVRAQCLSGVRAIVDDMAMMPFFEPATSRAEVPITGTVRLACGPRAVSGKVDRLAILETGVRIIDFKTDRTAPAHALQVPDGYVTQMALYRHLVQAIWPGRAVEVTLLYTHAHAGPAHIHLDAARLDAALAALCAS